MLVLYYLHQVVSELIRSSFRGTRILSEIIDLGWFASTMMITTTCLCRLCTHVGRETLPHHQRPGEPGVRRRLKRKPIYLAYLLCSQAQRVFFSLFRSGTIVVSHWHFALRWEKEKKKGLRDGITEVPYRRHLNSGYEALKSLHESSRRERNWTNSLLTTRGWRCKRWCRYGMMRVSMQVISETITNNLPAFLPLSTTRTYGTVVRSVDCTHSVVTLAARLYTT